MPVNELLTQYGETILGNAHLARHGASFPLLVKLLDTAAPLSIQVHPNDDFARAEGLPSGKEEMWYVLPDGAYAELLLGLREEVSVEKLAETAQNGRIAELLNRVRVKAGESYLVPAGTIHALGAGHLVIEVQQPSDTTYRLYDWGRLDASGKPRELHLEAGIRCADHRAFDATPSARTTLANGRESLVNSQHFAVYASGNTALPTDRPLLALALRKNVHIKANDNQRFTLPEYRCALLPHVFLRQGVKIEVEEQAGDALLLMGV